MSIRFPCCFCGHKLKGPAKAAGRRAKCPQCSKVVTVPHPDANAVRDDDGKISQPALTLPAPVPAEVQPTSMFLRGVSFFKRFDQRFRLLLGAWVTAGILVVGVFVFLMPGCNHSDERPAASTDPTTTEAAKVETKRIEAAGQKTAVAPKVKEKSPVSSSPADFVLSTAAPANPPVSAALPDPGPALQKTLEDGLRVSGAVASQSETEAFGKDQTWKGRRWNIHLQLVNETPWALELGKDFFLYEADATNINGVAFFRGYRPKNEPAAHLMDLQAAEPFGLADNYLLFGENGAIVQVRGPRTRFDAVERHPNGSVTLFDEPPTFSENPDEDPTKSFGPVQPKQKRPFDLRLSQGRWLRDEALKHVFVVLPEITVSAVKASPRFRLLISFRQSAAGNWEPDRPQLIRVDAEEMARLLEKNDTNLVTRLCLANWLMEIDPNKGKVTLSRVAESMEGGHLLATCLHLMTETKSSGMERRAGALLSKNTTPPYIRAWCAVYLGVLRHEPAFKALASALHDPDAQVAEGAAHGLGAYAGPDAAAGLLARLRKTKGPEEAAWLAENILFIKDRGPHVLPALTEFADRNHLEVLQAMARCGPPELFPYFQARAGREKKWRGLVAQGLWTTGRDKSVPSLLQMLEKDPPPPAGSPLQRSELVDALAFSSPPHEAPDLVAGTIHLANLGNLSATQVLAEWKLDAVRTVLIRFVRDARPAQAEVALDGLVRHWPQDSFEAFGEVLKSTNPRLLCLAVQGLGRSQNPAAKELLARFLNHANRDVCFAATEALRELGH